MEIGFDRVGWVQWDLGGSDAAGKKKRYQMGRDAGDAVGNVEPGTEGMDGSGRNLGDDRDTRKTFDG
jgi:hypothetical protein